MPDRIQTYEDAERFLVEQLPTLPKENLDPAEKFELAKEFMHMLGDPQEEYRTVHIAGTSGKGSVTYFASELLSAHGFSVGRHTSPHFYDIRERFTVDGAYARKEAVVKGVRDIMPVLKSTMQASGERPGFMPATYGLAYKVFADSGIDYAVVETGMGGRYDPTNVVQRTDKLALISRLGLDHTHALGDTVPEIAYQKAGIFRPDGNGLFVKPDDPEVEKVIQGVARERHAAIREIDPRTAVSNVEVSLGGTTFDYTGPTMSLPELRLKSIGTHQAENAALALSGLEFLSERDGFALDEKAIRHTLENLLLPGRFEQHRVDGRLLIFDGAHNEQKMESVLATIAEVSVKKPIFIIGRKPHAQPSPIFRPLRGVASEVVATESFRGKPNLEWLVESAEAVAAQAREAGHDAVTVEPDPKRALEYALAKAEDDQPIVITGTIYLLKEARHHAGLS